MVHQSDQSEEEEAVVVSVVSVVPTVGVAVARQYSTMVAVPLNTVPSPTSYDGTSMNNACC